MRILLGCAAFPPVLKGGGPVSSLIYAKALQAAGHEVLCLNVADHETDDVLDGVPVRRLPTLNLYWDYYGVSHAPWQKLTWHALENFNPVAYRVMRREIRAFRPDIFVTVSIENINVAAWAAARAEGVPVAHCIHSYFLLCWRGSMFKRGQNCSGRCAECKLASLGKRFMTRFVDGVHAETRFVVDTHLKHRYFPNAICDVIPGGIDRVRPARPRRSNDQPLRVGYMGVLRPFKGVDTLGTAARLLQGRSDIEFHIAGTGDADYAAKLKTIFPEANTRFLGWMQQEALLSAIDVLVVPSVWREPFARTIIEALSFGIPVLGADSGGIAETIVDGHNGFVFNPGDATRLAEIIAMLADDAALVARLSSSAHGDAQNYLPHPIGMRLGKFFNAVISHCSRGKLGSGAFSPTISAQR